MNLDHVSIGRDPPEEVNAAKSGWLIVSMMKARYIPTALDQPWQPNLGH